MWEGDESMGHKRQLTPPPTPAKKKSKQGKQGVGGKPTGAAPIMPGQEVVTVHHPMTYNKVVLRFGNSHYSYPTNTQEPPATFWKDSGLMILDVLQIGYYLRQDNPSGDAVRGMYGRNANNGTPIPRIIQELWNYIYNHGYIILDAEIKIDSAATIQKQKIQHTDGTTQYLLSNVPTPKFMIHDSQDGRINYLKLMDDYKGLDAEARYGGNFRQVKDFTPAWKGQGNMEGKCYKPEFYFDKIHNVPIDQGLTVKPNFKRGTRIVPRLNNQFCYYLTENTSGKNVPTYKFAQMKKDADAYFSHAFILPQAGGMNDHYFDCEDGQMDLGTLSRQSGTRERQEEGKPGWTRTHAASHHQAKPLIMHPQQHQDIDAQTTVKITREIVIEIDLASDKFDTAYWDEDEVTQRDLYKKYSIRLNGQAEQQVGCPQSSFQDRMVQTPDGGSITQAYTGFWNYASLNAGWPWSTYHMPQKENCRRDAYGADFVGQPAVV